MSGKCCTLLSLDVLISCVWLPYPGCSKQENLRLQHEVAQLKAAAASPSSEPTAATAAAAADPAELAFLKEELARAQDFKDVAAGVRSCGWEPLLYSWFCPGVREHLIVGSAVVA